MKPDMTLWQFCEKDRNKWNWKNAYYTHDKIFYICSRILVLICAKNYQDVWISQVHRDEIKISFTKNRYIIDRWSIVRNQSSAGYIAQKLWINEKSLERFLDHVNFDVNRGDYNPTSSRRQQWIFEKIQEYLIPEISPIYFLDVTVENVRCFGEKQTLKLSSEEGKPARWTIILGDNGTGKTTLLQCLVGFQSANLFVYAGHQIPKNGGTLYTFGTLEQVFEIFKRSGTSDKELLPTIEASEFYIGMFDSETIYKIPGIKFVDGSSSQIRWKPELEKLVIYAYGASRRMGSGELLSPISNLSHNDVASLFYEDGRLINAEEWLLQAYLTYKRSQEQHEQDIQVYAERRYEKVKQTLLMLLPDITDIQISPVSKAQLKTLVEVKTPYGWVEMKSLSLGYRTFIAWVVDLASRLFDRYPNSENPLAEPAIVLVDEIDLHLHPKWQRTIVNYLTKIFSNTQFVVTAHSPLVVQALPRDANIILLKREQAQVIIHNNQEEKVIYGWRLDQIVTSDLFDLPSARPIEYDELLRKREEILAKDDLSPEDEIELERIGSQLSLLPITPSIEEHEAMELIRKAAHLLRTHGSL